MTVTAIMPSLNQGHWIGQSLESLATDPAVGEILVLDQGSTDSTAAEVAKYPRARWIPARPPRGAPAAIWGIWHGILLASQPWCVVATTSDWFAQNAVSELLRYADDPRVQYVGAGTVVHETDGTTRLKLPAPGWLTVDDVIDGGQMPGISIFRQRVALTVGYVPLREDGMIYAAYLLHILTHGGLARRIARPLIHFRRHAGSLSGSREHAAAVHAENLAQRRRLAEQYADVLTGEQRRRLMVPAPGYERLSKRARRYVARRWYGRRTRQTHESPCSTWFYPCLRDEEEQ